MEIVWQAEIDEWNRRVLHSHWPDIHIYNDVREIDERAESVELLVGGFPCQDLSVAGRRKGFEGERSSLFFEFARIAEILQPQWFLLENVHGIFSSANGRDFGVVLSEMAQLGYGICWRVLDARFFGVAQRRRRVFIVGCLGENGRERAIRALSESGEGNFETDGCSWQKHPTRSEESPRIARCLTSRSTRLDASTENLIYQKIDQIVRRLTPRECERLMSWPDDWTAIDGDKTSDNRRYGACGNGVVSNVSEWIGHRILTVHNE